MNKEPISLYLFRLLLMVGLFGFLLMLYWSSISTEENTRSLKFEISQVKNDILALRLSLDKIKEEIGNVFLPNTSPPKEKNPEEHREQGTEDNLIYPNLLSKDPFYEKTLPKLLGPNFVPSGIRKQATVGKPDNLHPFSNWLEIASWVNLCTVSVATQKFGIFETYAPEMAIKMELRNNQEGKSEYWLHLRKDVYWQALEQAFFPNQPLAPLFLQKHQVTAHDFKFYYDAIMNPHVQEGQAVALRIYYSDIEEVRVVDDFTLVVRWKTTTFQDDNGTSSERMKYMSKMWTSSFKPLAVFVYQYFPDGTKIIENDSDPNTYKTNPIWAQNFSQHWAKNVIPSCGPWIFNGLTDREIRFKRNPEFFSKYAALVDEIEVKFKPSSDEVWEEFKIGAIDMFQVPPNQQAEVERFMNGPLYAKQAANGLGIRKINFVDRSYNYIGWNQSNPLFKSQKVRQALYMAIDRQRIISNILNNMGVEITGTFFRFSPSYDESIVPYPYDPELAKTFLAEEGWYDQNGDGLIEKRIDGKLTPFKFTLNYFVKNQTSKAISEYIATALKEINIECNISGLDVADLSAAFEDKSFDAIYLGWALGSPPEDPKQLWYTSNNEKGSSNVIGFSNKEIDRIIEKLEYEYDRQKRISLYHQFDKILYEEAPYVFLYTPKVMLVYREYLQNVFIPAERQDLIPGANEGEPQMNVIWIKQSK